MIKRLPEMCNIQYGYAFDSSGFSDDSSFPPLVRIRDVKRGYSETFYVGEYPKEYIVHTGDLLIGMDGEFNIARWKSRDALLNQRVCKITAKEGIDEEYLRFALSKVLKEIENRTSFVTVKHLSAKELNKLQLQVPNLPEQQRIANILVKIEQVLTSRNLELQILDNLIKSRFVEMFGEPEHNTKMWPIQTLDKLCTVKSSKRIYQNEQSSEGVPFWRVSDLVSKINTGVVDSELFIPEETYISLKQAMLVPKEGDILVTSRGTLGRCYIVKEEDLFYFQDGMISWLSDYSENITPLYLQYLFSMPGFNKQIDEMQAGSTVAYLSIAMLKKLRVMVPSRIMQNCFAAFVTQTDKTKSLVQRSLAQAQTLFAALMQEYFG